jgi:hypothetical protein
MRAPRTRNPATIPAAMPPTAAGLRHPEPGYIVVALEAVIVTVVVVVDFMRQVKDGTYRCP